MDDALGFLHHLGRQTEKLLSKYRKQVKNSTAQKHTCSLLQRRLCCLKSSQVKSGFLHISGRQLPKFGCASTISRASFTLACVFCCPGLLRSCSGTGPCWFSALFEASGKVWPCWFSVLFTASGKVWPCWSPVLFAASGKVGPCWFSVLFPASGKVCPCWSPVLFTASGKVGPSWSPVFFAASAVPFGMLPFLAAALQAFFACLACF